MDGLMFYILFINFFYDVLIVVKLFEIACPSFFIHCLWFYVFVYVLTSSPQHTPYLPFFPIHIVFHILCESLPVFPLMLCSLCIDCVSHFFVYPSFFLCFVVEVFNVFSLLFSCQLFYYLCEPLFVIFLVLNVSFSFA